MDTFEVILSRRSIRQFTSQPIDNGQIEKLLQAAMQAPSARNTQSWQFIVINEREKLNQIADFHPYADMLRIAPLAIAVCGDRGLEISVEYCALNCAAATENILLAAHASNLGAVWLGVYPREKRIADLKKILNLPEKVVPISLIALGYPAEKKNQEDRFKKNKIHLNSW